MLGYVWNCYNIKKTHCLQRNDSVSLLMVLGSLHSPGCLLYPLSWSCLGCIFEDTFISIMHFIINLYRRTPCQKGPIHVPLIFYVPTTIDYCALQPSIRTILAPQCRFIFFLIRNFLPVRDIRCCVPNGFSCADRFKFFTCISFCPWTLAGVIF